MIDDDRDDEPQRTICPDCGEPIHWYGIIKTGQPGQANYIEGECPCSEWQSRDEGGLWICYSKEHGDHEWERVE